MLLEGQELPAKITTMTYCDHMSMLSVGLSNGMIVTFTLQIESYNYSGGLKIHKQAEMNSSNNKSQNKKPIQRSSRQLL